MVMNHDSLTARPPEAFITFEGHDDPEVSKFCNLANCVALMGGYATNEEGTEVPMVGVYDTKVRDDVGRPGLVCAVTEEEFTAFAMLMRDIDPVLLTPLQVNRAFAVLIPDPDLQARWDNREKYDFLKAFAAQDSEGQFDYLVNSEGFSEAGLAVVRTAGQICVRHAFESTEPQPSAA